MDVSIIIVNYNTKELTYNCIKSVFEKTKDLIFEVVVVDNASIDGSTELIKEKFPQVRIIQNEKNIGFGAANNIAINNTNSKYVFFLNSDTILLNNAVKHLHDYLEQNDEENIGALGTILLDDNLMPTLSYANFLTVFSFLKGEFYRFIARNFKLSFIPYKIIKKLFSNINNKKKFDNSLAEVFEVDYISGAALFVKRSVLKLVDSFDPRFFMYCEEEDMQYKMSKLGMKRIVYKKPLIIHLEGKSSTFSNKKRILAYVSIMKYARKHLGYKRYLLKYAFMLIVFFESIINIINKKYSFKENTEYITKLFNETY